MTESATSSPVSLLAEAWLEAGQRAPAPVVKGQAVCMLPGCGLDGWVQIKTHHGPIVVCFGHFSDVRDLVQSRTQIRKRPPSTQSST